MEAAACPAPTRPSVACTPEAQRVEAAATAQPQTRPSVAALTEVQRVEAAATPSADTSVGLTAQEFSVWRLLQLPSLTRPSVACNSSPTRSPSMKSNDGRACKNKPQEVQVLHAAVTDVANHLVDKSTLTTRTSPPSSSTAVLMPAADVLLFSKPSSPWPSD